MARNTDAPESSYGFVFASIFYGIITIIAIGIGFYSNAETAFMVQLICAAIASIILAFNLPKGKEHTEKRKRASYIFVHLLLWAGILFIPFGDNPKMFLAALFLLGISETGYISALNKDANDQRSNDSKFNTAEIAGKLAMMILALIIIMFVAKKTGYDKVIIGWGKNVIEKIVESKKDSDSNGDETQAEKVKDANLEAHFLQWGSPMVLNIDHPFTTKAVGKVNLNDRTSSAVNAVIYLKTSGNILLVNGRVVRADKDGGQCTGSWKQPQTGLSGTYVLDALSTGYAHLILRHSGNDIAEIEFK